MDHAEIQTRSRHWHQDPDHLRARISQALPETGPDAHPIQVWQPVWEDGALVFRRPPPGPLGDHYAARQTIPAGKAAGTKRVCYFGESAAAGYLYAPWLTPAGEIERRLNAVGGTRWEVIDLARTNETLDGMQQALHAALQLDPDVYVIFAGNNWPLLENQEISPLAGDAIGRQAFGEALDSEGPFGPIRAADRVRLERIAGFYAGVAHLAAENDVHVVVVVPEVNLLDWDARQPVAWLPGDGVEKWYRALQEAEKALAARDWDGAFEAGKRMLALDRGANPTAFAILARSRVGAGAPDKARIAARAGVEAGGYAWMHFLEAPRAVEKDQDLIRSAAAHHGFGLVDLPAVFADRAGTAGAGRRMFLDYCHLTREGIRVAAGAIAAGVVAGVKEATALHQDAAVDAAAMFGAALHSAHRMPSGPLREELLSHWVRSAWEADPTVVERMLGLAAARAARLPVALTPSHRKNAAAEYPLVYAHGWDYPHLDAAVLDALLEALGTLDPAAAEGLVDTLLAGSAAAPLDDNLKDGTPEGEINLADPYYLAEPLERRHDALLPQADPAPEAVLRVYLPWSEFVFPDRGAADRQLACSLRLPPGTGEDCHAAKVRLSLNGRRLADLAAGQAWETWTIEVPAGTLQRGLNRLRIDWPYPNANGRTMMRAAVDQLRLGGRGECRPVFGEIFTLRLT